MITRRRFVNGAALAGAAGVLGIGQEALAAEPPPEITRIRLAKTSAGVCLAPQYLAEELLKNEGFTTVQYLTTGRVGANQALAAGSIDLMMGFVGSYIRQIDAADPILMLGGVHVGCYELFASDRIRSVRDLKGKAIGVTELGSGRHVFLQSALSYVGLDPNKDVTFVTQSSAECMQRFAEGKLDAYQAFAEDVPALRARKTGHVILNSTTDRPWSQYYCCVLAANREFVRKYPIATKRAMRAILKASSLCERDPDGAARLLVDRKFTTAQYEHVRSTIQSLPYTKWHEYDPQDTIRFYAVRLHEVGMVKSSPKKIIAQGTDWRFLNELKKELKA
jgi:NitT/TauT family transport system substrate-binding protein